VSDVVCSMCGEPTAPDHAIIGDAGAICVACVWMCVDILEERGEKRPSESARTLGGEFDDEETSQVYERGSIPPPK
jgi:hypothetical protein